MRKAEFRITREHAECIKFTKIYDVICPFAQGYEATQ